MDFATQISRRTDWRPNPFHGGSAAFVGSKTVVPLLPPARNDWFQDEANALIFPEERVGQHESNSGTTIAWAISVGKACEGPGWREHIDTLDNANPEIPGHC